MKDNQSVREDADRPATTPTAALRHNWSRRDFLRVGVAGSASLGLLASGTLARPPAKLSRPGGRPKRGGMTFDQDLVLLLKRITGGFNLWDYLYAESIGYEAYLAEQLALDFEDPDPALDQRLIDYYDFMSMSARDLRAAYNPPEGPNHSIYATRQATSIQVMWAIYARPQLFYRMFQFWNHHLNINIQDGMQRYLLWPFLRDVIRYNAMGSRTVGDEEIPATVPALIKASASAPQSPAMLYYLNNNTNHKDAPNENYAREIMELHTLGVDNTYTQNDIQLLARLLTGWTLCWNYEDGCDGGQSQYLEFRYIPSWHDTDAKLGFLGEYDFPAGGGLQEGLDAIDILTAHEDTAEFISRKLCRFFLGGIGYEYNPPEDIVQMVKWTYLDTGGEINPMLEIILQRDVLTQYAVPKFRRPFDLTTAACRAIQADITPTQWNFLDPWNDTGLSYRLETMGMRPNFWEPPNGPYDSKAWSAGSSLTRWNFIKRLVEGQIDSIAGPIVVGDLLDQVDANAPGLQAWGLSALLTGAQMSNKELENLQDFIGYGNPSESRLREALALAMQMPTFQFI